MEKFGQMPMVPKVETIKDDELSNLSLEEEERLFSKEKDMSPRKKKIMKALCAITVAASICCGSIVHAAERNNNFDRGIENNHQIVEVKKDKRDIEIGGWLKNLQVEGLNTDGLELGKAKHPVRDPGEIYGIYVEGIHFGDVHAGSAEGYKFTKEEFEDKVVNVLKNHRSMSSKVLDSWGIHAKGTNVNDMVIYGFKDKNGNSAEISFDKETVRAETIVIDDSNVVINVFNKDGSKDQVKIVDGVIDSIMKNKK